MDETKIIVALRSNQRSGDTLYQHIIAAPSARYAPNLHIFIASHLFKYFKVGYYYY